MSLDDKNNENLNSDKNGDIQENLTNDAQDSVLQNEDNTDSNNLSENTQSDGPKIYYENIAPQSDVEIKPQKPKKNRVINTSIIIGICIVALAIIGAAVYYIFFDNQIVGTWTLDDQVKSLSESTQDQADNNIMYFTFEKDGEAKVTMASLSWTGTYTLENQHDDTTNTDSLVANITLMNPYYYGASMFPSNLRVVLSGNKITGRHMVLSTDEYTYGFTSSKIKEVYVEPFENFKTDDKIVDTWVYSEDGAEYKYIINKDGTMVFSQGDSTQTLLLSCVYTISGENEIKTKCFAGGIVEDTLTYGYDEDKDTLVINGLGYTRQGAQKQTASNATNDQA